MCFVCSIKGAKFYDPARCPWASARVARIAANEASALTSLRTINIATLAYDVKYGSFPETLAALGPVANGEKPSAERAGSIDAALASGTKDGYLFEYRPGRSDADGKILEYELSAEPVTEGITGRNSYFTDQTGLIRTPDDYEFVRPPGHRL